MTDGDTASEQMPNLGDVLNMDGDGVGERKWIVLYEEDYEELVFDRDDSVALLVDNDQALEVLKLASQMVADLAPEHAPDKEPIQAMIDALEEAGHD